jgi:hypothetical protein
MKYLFTRSLTNNNFTLGVGFNFLTITVLWDGIMCRPVENVSEKSAASGFRIEDIP